VRRQPLLVEGSRSVQLSVADHHAVRIEHLALKINDGGLTAARAQPATATAATGGEGMAGVERELISRASLAAVSLSGNGEYRTRR